MLGISPEETTKRLTLALRHSMSPFFTINDNSSPTQTDYAGLWLRYMISKFPSKTGLKVLARDVNGHPWEENSMIFVFAPLDKYDVCICPIFVLISSK